MQKNDNIEEELCVINLYHQKKISFSRGRECIQQQPRKREEFPILCYINIRMNKDEARKGSKHKQQNGQRGFLSNQKYEPPDKTNAV